MYSVGYLGTSGGRGDHFGAGGGIATIPYSTIAARGGGTAAIGTPIPYSNRLIRGRELAAVVLESRLRKLVGFLRRQAILSKI